MGRADAVHGHHDGAGTHVVADGAGPHCAGYQVGDSPFQGLAALGECIRPGGHERGQRPGEALVGVHVIDHAAQEGYQGLLSGERGLQLAGAVA